MSYPDIEFAVNYVSKKYVRDPLTNEKRTRLYAYGVSLGAVHLGLYLGRAGKRASEVLDGACLYSGVWNARRANPAFVARLGGVYNYLLGMNNTMNIKSK